MNDKPRLLFHVQHMLGIGHRIRAERIALACVDVGFDVTLMEGGVPALECDTPPGLTRVQLPSARSADAAFSAVVDADTGQVVDDAWRARRLAASLAALETSQPDILLVEGFPFARPTGSAGPDNGRANRRIGAGYPGGAIRSFKSRPDCGINPVAF